MCSKTHPAYSTLFLSRGGMPASGVRLLRGSKTFKRKSQHPFFCFLLPLICSSFLSLSRPAALVKYLQDETASKRFEPVSSQSPGVEGYGEAANTMVRKAEDTYPWKGQRPLRGHGSKSWMKRTKNLDLQDLIFVRAILRRRIDPAAFRRCIFSKQEYGHD